MNTTLWQWMGGVLVLVVFALALAYEVHWLLVRSDHREYRRLGGSLGLLAFRRRRQALRDDYFEQRIRLALHRGIGELPPTLGQFVREIEQGLPIHRVH